MAGHTMISSEIPDWSREFPRSFWDPSRKLLKAIRDYQSIAERPWFIRRIIKDIAILRHRFWSVVCGCDIPLNTVIGGGLKLTHPNGVVIHPRARIGVNCLILQQVTLVAGVELDGQVDIGAGAKIIRPVKIGAHAKIGANAVVVHDIPPGAVVVGNPAKVIKFNSDKRDTVDA